MYFNICRSALFVFTLSLTACSSTSFVASDIADVWRNVIDLRQGNIRKSPDDTRRYQYLTLDNQLKVLLISDTSAEKAAASLDVHVGSRYDPADYQGLAHFLEHMLFLGTAKYPDADGYQKFISENGGSHNAYTSFEHTNYYFNIDNASLAPALDRFSDFFVSPLFDASYVEREVNAVESEYRARIKDENRRVLDATRQLIHPEHPYRQFTVGGLQTLSSPSTRDAMLDFYQRYYSASRMTLVVIGDYSLAELKNMVLQRFEWVANNNSQTNAINVPLFDTDKYRLPLLLSVQSEKPIRQLRFTFPMPDLSDNYRSKPLSYIGNILGHEGKGSLLSTLKAKGLAEGLSAGVGLNYTGGSTFQLSIALTDKGVGHVQQITDDVFFAINYLREQHQQQPDVSRALFLEQRQLAAMAFRFYQQPTELSIASGAAANLHFYPPAEVISGDYDYSEYRPALITESLSRLVPDNVLLTLVAQTLPNDADAQQLSPWFSAPYSIEKIHVDFHDELKSNPENKTASRDFSLPMANDFIAKDFKLFDAVNKSDTPSLMFDQAGLRLWVKTDDTFEVPKANIYLSFLTSSSRESSRHTAMSALYSLVVNEQLNEYLYPAYLAGLDVAFYSQMRGFVLGLGGYNDGLMGLAEKILPALTDITIEPARFESLKAELKQSWALSIESAPYRRLSSTMQQSLYANSWSETELINVLADISLADVQGYVNALWPSVYVEGLAHGNIDKTTAQALAELLASLPNCDCDWLEGRPPIAVVKLPLGRQQQAQRLNHNDAAVLWYFQAPDDSLRSSAMTQLSASILHPRLFNQLRTEQQLGYVVGARAFNLFKLPGIALQVQSPSNNEQEIIAALSAFIDELLEQGIDTEAFDRHRQALALRLREGDQNLSDRSRRFWGGLALADETFDRRERLAVIIDQLSYEDWLSFVQTLFSSQEASLIQLTESLQKGESNTSSSTPRPINKQKIIYYR